MVFKFLEYYPTRLKAHETADFPEATFQFVILHQFFLDLVQSSGLEVLVDRK